MENQTFTFSTFSGSTPLFSELYENKKYTTLEFNEEKLWQSFDEWKIAYPSFLEYRTAYGVQNSPFNINLFINFDDIERRKFLYDLNTESKNKS